MSFIGQERLLKGACGNSGLGRSLRPIDIADFEPVPCSRDVFAAHGFTCPASRHSPERKSEVFGEGSDYYPIHALRENMEGVVRVRVTLDPTGSPVDCKIVKSSGHDLLDRHTCKLVGTDPAFTAPRPPTPNGDLSGVIDQPVVWVLPDE